MNAKHATDAEIIAAYKAPSIKIIDIVKTLRVGRVRLRAVVKKYGLKTRNCRHDTPDVMAAVEAYKRGEPAMEIERKTGINNQRLYHSLRRHGILTQRASGVRKKKKLWCLWCGNDLSEGRFCDVDCKRSYSADVKNESANQCKECGKTMPLTRLKKECTVCDSERKKRSYNRLPRRTCAAQGCDVALPTKRKVYCSAECRNATHTKRYSEDEVADIMRRVAQAKAFGPVAKELGIKRVSLIGILFRLGFTLERETHETHGKAKPSESSCLTSP